MLIVHPSSSCDICLDAYDWDTPTQMPHAIPCGHIFCKTCLMSMGSPSCPFCRKPFIASRIVKLHVDRPATSEQGVEDVELLQRLDAEEAKRQVELEAAVEQSKQRKRALRESLERAQRFRKQREEEAETCKQQLRTVAGKCAPGVLPSTREIWFGQTVLRIIDEPSVTHTVEAAAPPSTRSGQGEGGGWTARRDANADLTSPLVSSAAPSSTLFGRGWRARAARQSAALTSSSGSSTNAPLHVNTSFTFVSDSEIDGNGSP